MPICRRGCARDTSATASPFHPTKQSSEVRMAAWMKVVMMDYVPMHAPFANITETTNESLRSPLFPCARAEAAPALSLPSCDAGSQPASSLYKERSAGAAATPFLHRASVASVPRGPPRDAAPTRGPPFESSDRTCARPSLSAKKSRAALPGKVVGPCCAVALVVAPFAKSQSVGKGQAAPPFRHLPTSLVGRKQKRQSRSQKQCCRGCARTRAERNTHDS